MNNELISVIVPVYKVEKYLDKCIGSIASQTHANLEIILVDDGSPDGCPIMCDEWAKRDGRIKVIHKQNGGLSSARNAGIDVARGDYLMFVDSDDFISTQACEKLLSLIKRYDANLAMCQAQLFSDDGKIEELNYEETTEIYENPIELLYDSKIPYLMTAWGKLYKKEIFNKIRFPLGKLHEDEFVIHGILDAAKSFVVTTSKWYYYLQRPGSIMGSRGEKSLRHTLEAFQQRFEFLNSRYPNNYQKNVNLYLSQLRAVYLLNRKVSKEIRREILGKYYHTYKLIEKHYFKDKLFRYFRPMYCLLCKIKNL